jgi:hypothetical protein
MAATGMHPADEALISQYLESTINGHQADAATILPELAVDSRRRKVAT